jgi:hypothetical protein
MAEAVHRLLAAELERLPTAVLADAISRATILCGGFFGEE